MFASKKSVIQSILLVAVFGLMVSNASAQQAALKFAFIDVDKIFEDSTHFKQAFKDIQKSVDESKKNLEKMNADLKDKVENFQVKKELLNDETAKQQRVQIEDDRQKLVAQTEQEDKKFNAMKAKLLAPLLKALQTVVDEVAKEDAYTFIFKRSTLAYCDSKMDITDKVRERLDKMEIKAEPAKSAAPAVPAAKSAEKAPEKKKK